MRKKAIIRQVIVLGGGPAGISAAIWLKKLGADVILLEASDALGGLQRRSPYDNLWIPGVQGRTGQDVARALSGHAAAVGVEVRLNTGGAPVTREDEMWSAGGFCAHHLVLATGARPRAGRFKAAHNVAIGPGEPMEAMEVANRRIAILGGGDNAFDQARFVRDRGGEVTVFSRAAPRAQKLLQEMIADVRVVTGPYRASQKTMTVNGEVFDGFGVMYGFEAVVPDGIGPRRQGGYVRVDRFGATSLPGIFACGEVTDYWHPCVTTAAAHGVQVAKQIAQRLGK
ncbi:MAG: NAD(P)/FAD-dependent oxidoreductase [Asticcacaulis sp.]